MAFGVDLMEKFPEYVKRKMEEIEELIATAKTHTSVIINFTIADTVIRDSMGGLKPIRRIIVELNESKLQELKDSK